MLAATLNMRLIVFGIRYSPHSKWLLTGVLSCSVAGAVLVRAGVHEDGWNQIAFKNFTGAVSLFERARQESEKGSEGWTDAIFGLGVALMLRQPDTKTDKIQAAALFDEIAALPVKQPVQAMALLFRGRLADQVDYYGDAPDARLAMAHYDRILSEWPDSHAAAFAALYRAQLGVGTMDKETVRRSVAELRAWIEEHPRNLLASHQWILIALALLYPLDDKPGAVEAFVRAQQAGLPPNTRMDYYYWRLARLAEQAGERQTAIDYYRKIIIEVQRTAFAYESQLRLRAMGEEPPPLIDPFIVEDTK